MSQNFAHIYISHNYTICMYTNGLQLVKSKVERKEDCLKRQIYAELVQKSGLCVVICP